MTITIPVWLIWTIAVVIGIPIALSLIASVVIGINILIAGIKEWRHGNDN